MVIDLRKCVGCGACSVICDQTNKLAFNRWRRVFDCGVSDAPERQRLCMPLSCMHCNDAPCREVCPTGATHRRTDGIIDIDYSRCIGCGYCIMACPYHARSILFQNEYAMEVGTLDGDVSPENRLGVATKCNFCRPRIDEGLKKGLIPGRNPEASPACVISCSAGALFFGDFDNPDSEASGLIRDNMTVLLQEELETHPSVYYLVDDSWKMR